MNAETLKSKSGKNGWPEEIGRKCETPISTSTKSCPPTALVHGLVLTIADAKTGQRDKNEGERVQNSRHAPHVVIVIVMVEQGGTVKETTRIIDHVML